MPVSRTMTEDLSADHLSKENINEKFYNPLSVTGYLTPLQRKKLREIRGLSPPIFVETKKDIKPRLLKRKKEINTFMHPKIKDKPKKTKQKHISHIQWSAAKIVCKTSESLKENKFFKTSSPNRLERANFSMPFVFKKNLFSKIDKNIKDSVSHFKKRRILDEYNVNSHSYCNDFDNTDRTSNSTPCIVKIDNFSNSTDCFLQRELDENKMTESVPEKSVFDFDWPSDEELLKRQKEARESLKKGKVTKESIDNIEVDVGKEQKDIDVPVKYYPIFYLSSKKQSSSHQDNKRKQKSGLKKVKDDDEQMIIDAGQKKFGAQMCSTCNMIYSAGVDEDEKLHSDYHNMYQINLKFTGWKDENVIAEYNDGRIILVQKNEQSYKIKKIEDVLEIANRDLGFPVSSLPPKPDLTFLLFVANSKQVIGCVVAEPVSQASRVLLAEENESASALPPVEKETGTWRIGNWYASSETVPAVCGVNRIWVAHNYRRCKVASRMIDCLRCHFVYGHVIGIRELAFTDPSPDGREFAASYTGTNNFLVYQ